MVNRLMPASVWQCKQGLTTAVVIGVFANATLPTYGGTRVEFHHRRL
jgi:hypothetical protein